MVNPLLVKGAVDAATGLAKAAPGIITAGQDATEKRKWGKQKRKQDQSDWKTENARASYYDNLQKGKVEENDRMGQAQKSVSGEGLYGRWANESRDFKNYSHQVDTELRKAGHIRTENYKEGKKKKTREVYSPDIDRRRGEAYDKILGYKMTRDQNNKLIGSQDWDSVNKNDEAIIAGEYDQRKKKQRSDDAAYGVWGSASENNRFM